MSQMFLDIRNVKPCVKQVCGNGVAKAVDAILLVQTRSLGIRPEKLLNPSRTQSPLPAGKQSFARVVSYREVLFEKGGRVGK